MKFKSIKQFVNKNNKNLFMIDTNSKKKISFCELYYLSQNLQYILKKKRISKEKEFLIRIEPDILLISIFLSLTFFNYKITPADYSKFELLKTGSKNIIKNENGKVKITFSSGTKKENIKFDFKNLIKKNSSNLPFEQKSSILNYSSGTTGKPKIIIQNIMNFFKNGTYFVNANSLNSSNKFLNILPLNYMGGFFNTLIICLLCGGRVILGSTFSSLNILNFWRFISKYKINTVWLTPNALSLILKANENKKIKNIYLKKCLVGMDTLSSDLKYNFEKKFNTKIFESYGMTETTFISCQLSKKQTIGNVGNIIRGVKIKIKKTYKNSNEGEIFVKSPFLSSSILDGRSNKSKWYNTGDVGKINSDKSLSLIGRKKDVIIKNGINLSSAFIENHYRKIKFVKNCALIGLKNPSNFNQVKTILLYSLKNSFPKKYNSIILNFKQHLLNNFEIPDHFIKIDHIPTTLSGKIKKKYLYKKFKYKYYNNEKN